MERLTRPSGTTQDFRPERITLGRLAGSKDPEQQNHKAERILPTL